MLRPEKPIAAGETPFQYDDVERPDIADDEALKGWSKFFKKHRPKPQRVAQWVMKSHKEGDHKQVIGCLQAALIHGQSQPWMYEVLALSMEIEGYPEEEVERVVLSLADFGSVSFENMMYSAAYLARLDRKAGALKLYRQASRISPERHEPYTLGLKLASEIGSVDDLQWAVEGVLLHNWSENHRDDHRNAEDAAFKRIRTLQKSGDREGIQAIQKTLAAAKIRDVSVRVEWSGKADIDLFVEEPPGSVCSFEEPLTIAGGIHLHDGHGTDRSESFESYICPQAVSGKYRVRVTNSLGNVVGNRVVVTITKHLGAATETKTVRTLVLEDGTAGMTFDLQDGRRNQPRDVSVLTRELNLPIANPRQNISSVRSEDSQRHRRGVAQQMVDDRLFVPGPQNSRPAGAFGYSPVVQTIPEGAALSGQVTVSADRRYVRMALLPSFTNVTDVFTFSFINGN